MYAISFDMNIDGRRAKGTYELDFDRMTKTQLVQDIREGQFAHIDRVYEFDAEEGTAVDATGDFALTIARDILQEDGEPPKSDLRDWLEMHCGMWLTQQFMRLDAYA